MMRGLRIVMAAALVALVAGSGCCRWWCHNCERWCGGHPQAVAAVPAVSAVNPCVCAPVVCCPAPVCCTPGTLVRSSPVVPAPDWQRCP